MVPLIQWHHSWSCITADVSPSLELHKLEHLEDYWLHLYSFLNFRGHQLRRAAGWAKSPVNLPHLQQLWETPNAHKEGRSPRLHPAYFLSHLCDTSPNPAEKRHLNHGGKKGQHRLLLSAFDNTSQHEFRLPLIRQPTNGFWRSKTPSCT